MIRRKRPRTAKVAFFSVSHATYNGQFPGLYDRFAVYHEELLRRIGENGVETVDFGLIDSSEGAYRTAEALKAAGVDLIVCNMITYATSSVFAPHHPYRRRSGHPDGAPAPGGTGLRKGLHLHAAGKR